MSKRVYNLYYSETYIMILKCIITLVVWLLFCSALYVSATEDVNRLHWNLWFNFKAQKSPCTTAYRLTFAVHLPAERPLGTDPEDLESHTHAQSCLAHIKNKRVNIPPPSDAPTVCAKYNHTWYTWYTWYYMIKVAQVNYDV